MLQFWCFTFPYGFKFKFYIDIFWHILWFRSTQWNWFFFFKISHHKIKIQYISDRMSDWQIRFKLILTVSSVQSAINMIKHITRCGGIQIFIKFTNPLANQIADFYFYYGSCNFMRQHLCTWKFHFVGCTIGLNPRLLPVAMDSTC